MTNQFIPRSQRQARENQEAFERSKDKLQNINQSNKDFWEKKPAKIVPIWSGSTNREG
jgi:hypothetical protein